MQALEFQDITTLPDNRVALLHAGPRYFFGYHDGHGRFFHRGARRDEPYRELCRPREFRYPTPFELQQLQAWPEGMRAHRMAEEGRRHGR